MEQSSLPSRVGLRLQMGPRLFGLSLRKLFLLFAFHTSLSTHMNVAGSPPLCVLFLVCGGRRNPHKVHVEV